MTGPYDDEDELDDFYEDIDDDNYFFPDEPRGDDYPEAPDPEPEFIDDEPGVD